MSKRYNWAILGCGKIAKKFSKDLKTLPNAYLYATASRNFQKATDFAKEFGFEKAYGSYLEMVNDINVDIVYIATPHNFHLEHSLLCLNNKKAVLCEKAFAINSKEVEQMITASKANNTFLMEAFWTIFQPKFKKIREIVNSKELGELKFVKSDFMFNGEFNPKNRLYNIDLGGGSLLDIGIYPVFNSLMLLGIPDSIKTIAQFSKTGSEESIAILFGYKNGSTAILSSSFAANCKNETELCFENGFLKIDRVLNSPILMNKNGSISNPTYEREINLGYHREAAHVMECLDNNLIESNILPHSFSLSLIKTLDSIRKDANIIYPNHD